MSVDPWAQHSADAALDRHATINDEAQGKFYPTGTPTGVRRIREESEAFIAEKNAPAARWEAARKQVDEFRKREFKRIDDQAAAQKASIEAEINDWLDHIRRELGWAR